MCRCTSARATSTSRSSAAARSCSSPASPLISGAPAPAGALGITRHGAVALLTIDHPRKRNALDPALCDALASAVAELPKQGVRAAVLTGAGDAAFSSGFDLSALPEQVTSAPDPLANLLTKIADGALPLVAALNGYAIGGGCELAATCDLRVAHSKVTLRMPPVRLGLVYPARGLRRFVGLIGAAHTRELFLTAAPIDAARALGWGLLDHVTATEAEVLPTALALANEIARGAPLAVLGVRAALERLPPALSPELEAELSALERAAWSSEDAREARTAFREKRPPRFTGR